jgi:23S rRNA (cytidine1920-2'-O)/16S rRNA (cytidine1409-2'-O)-methyltransferase
LPAIASLLAADAQLLLLVKPQFELAALGRGAELHGGIVPVALARESLKHLYNVFVEQGLQPRAVYASPLKGAKGNQEYFVLLQRAEAEPGFEAYCARVEEAMGTVEDAS